MRATYRDLTNRLLRPLGLKVVNTGWGPRGLLDGLQRLRGYGIRLQQIVDVGAAKGEWTRECLRVFPDARYFLVDPLPGNIPALQSLRNERPNVQFWTGALGASAQTVQFHVHGDQSSVYESNTFHAAKTLATDIRCLDSFLGTPGLPVPPDFIKADVQGMELEVLRGATRCLEGVLAVLLEVSFRQVYENAPLAHEVVAALGRWGFRIHDILTYTGRPADGELMQSDIVFARMNSPLFQDESYH